MTAQAVRDSEALANASVSTPPISSNRWAALGTPCAPWGCWQRLPRRHITDEANQIYADGPLRGHIADGGNGVGPGDARRSQDGGDRERSGFAPRHDPSGRH